MQKFIFFFAIGAWAVTQGTAEEEYVKIWPSNPVVEFGGSLDLNCTSTCENVGIESPYTKVSIENGSNWKTFRLSNVNYWPASPLCYADCKTGQKKSPKANIIIYKPPSHIELDTVPKMEVGKLYNLTCRVSGVAPIRNLTVTLLKGEEELLVKTFEDHSDPEFDDVVVNHNITAQQNDHNKTVTCQTSLDLNPSGPLVKNTSRNITLESFDFADVPLLHAGLFLEAGTPMKVTCDTPKISPANEAIFDLWFAGKSLNFSTTVMGGLASAEAVIGSFSVGDQELICKVSLGPVTKIVTKMVNVFALPKPILQIGSSLAVVNQTVNITCSAGGSASPGFKMQIMDAAKILASGNKEEHFLQHAVIAQQEDNGREFICQVILIIEGHIKERNISQNLTVFYGPQINDSNCPHALTWKEGSTTSFACSALGNPTPTVQCWKDGRPYNIGEPQLVQREHDGIYHCNATNQYGFDVRDVTIHVEYGPQINDSNCPHALTWKEGSTTSFACSALGNPTPTVQCWKDGRPYNIGEPQLVQREHDGIYHCNATNQYGFDVRDVTIHVESYQPNIFAIVTGTLAMVVVVIFLGGMVFYSRKKKCRIYHLWKRQQPQAAITSELQPCLNSTTNV